MTLIKIDGHKTDKNVEFCRKIYLSKLFRQLHEQG